MSQSVNLRFPSGHTIDQVKRNAKRLSEEQGMPLNKALDQLACNALGLPATYVRWAEAIKTLDLTSKYYGFTDDPAYPEETKNAFLDGVIVAIDIKDFMEFRNTGPWVQDEVLKVLMTPSLLALYAFTGANEDGRKIPKKSDWEYAWDGLMDPVIYRYTGPYQLKDEDAVIKDITDRNFFPPDLVWMGGRLQPFMHNVEGNILIF